MRLNEKGLQKVQKLCWENSHNYRKIAEELGFCDFEPDDFQGVVVLTVDEAKEIIGTYIGTNCEIVKQHGIPELKIKNPNWLIHLLERIEKAEGKE